MDNYVGGIKRPFSDVKKLVAGVVFNIIPVVNFLALGYILESGKLSIKKKGNLPEWNEVGHYFNLGFKGAVIAATLELNPVTFNSVSKMGLASSKGRPDIKRSLVAQLSTSNFVG